MSVLRQMSRSSREIGESETRLLRPKITLRRRLLRNASRWSTRSKYFSRSASGTPSTCFWVYVARRAVASASSSMSVA